MTMDPLYSVPDKAGQLLRIQIEDSNGQATGKDH